MTDAFDRDDVRAFLEVGPGMRGKLERALDALMDLLDGLEDPDLEETGDDEPDADTEASLGAPNEARSQERWGDGTPAMAWDADREGPEDELEPSLGSIGSCGSVYADQRGWARGADTEAEGDEHDGREPDEADEEPELGATVTLNQERAWAPQSDRRWYTTDGEPSLGWSNGRGHPEAAMRGYDDDREQDIADQPHDDFGGPRRCRPTLFSESVSPAIRTPSRCRAWST